MHITDYMSEKNWKKVLDFSEKLQTPCVIINLEKIKKNYLELKQLFPDADIYYAMKANPHEEILKLLIGLGANFDIASRYELDKILSLGVPPECLSYGNTIKKAKDIAYFYEKGVRLFATDSKEDLKNLAKYSPQSRVFVRILVENTNSADWPLSRKFGCHPDMAYDLCVLAKEMGLIPYGISFHVGSQQRDIGQWDDAIAKTKYLMRSLEEEEDIKLEMINMGGGFPAPYITPTNKLSEYAREITRYLDDDFGNEKPHIILEPGRSLVGDSGVLVTEIITISRKNNTALHRWVYVDAGVFNGLTETLNENIKYPIFTSKDESAGKWGEVVLAGPTCDSMDIMYEDYKYTMPISLKSGDRLYFLSTGAYTASYASVEFNGFPPIQTYIME
ncbi:Pyridoxal-dependent decarboxylase, pyridoxal binding domain protein [Treponema phagedenis F0421]|uniref:type III PLP-dependent enzyme n=1 Tax=Treponema phagedenis TaxID=162 RepID=UPI0001F64237|nr:type III PLP-dependent enzyme [Treponema phagedenis]EFW39291.1 Pyridoxal-dependent decarboxylase, pyridoxal binding domain protein [Treponema phagedenis F0421]